MTETNMRRWRWLMLVLLLLLALSLLILQSVASAEPLKWHRVAHKCCSDGVCLSMRHHTRVVVEEP